MKRAFRAAIAAAILPLGLASVGCAHNKSANGCNGSGGERANCGDRYRNWVDTSWPDRYNYAARQAVVAPFAQQAGNGHFLHQSIWNWYFEPGTDKLTAGGMDKLSALARTTPSPDPRIYIQTAQDLPVTADNMDKIASARSELNGKRAAAIKKYMATQFGPAQDYEVYVHDAPVPGISGAFAGSAYRSQLKGYVGGLSAGTIGIGSVGGGSGSGLPQGNTNASTTSTSTSSSTTSSAPPPQ